MLAVLDATGALESTEFVDRWWPVAIIGAGVLGMIVLRRLSLGMLVITAIDVALLADAQEWTTQDLLEPLLLVIIGLAILLGARRGRWTVCRTPRPAVRSLPGWLTLSGSGPVGPLREGPHYYLVHDVDMRASLEWLREENADRPGLGQSDPTRPPAVGTFRPSGIS